jgi:divalent metal cation (Fe/Co/Zn/Cd) transporter
VHGPGVHRSRLLRGMPVNPGPSVTPARRKVLNRRVRWIVGFTVAYNVIEAILAIAAGALASSAALIGFGLDSVIEVLSALAVGWQFTRKDPERWEKTTVRAIALAFFALATYITVDSILSLAGVQHVDHSPLGITIAALSLIIMPAVAWFERRTGKELGSASVIADSRQLLLCTYLSASVLVGLLLNTWLRLEWADAVAALVIAAFAVREGLEAWKGDVESPFEVLSEVDEGVTTND